MAIDARAEPGVEAVAASIRDQLNTVFPGRIATVLVATPGSGAALVEPAQAGVGVATGTAVSPPLPVGGISSAHSALAAVLREADRRGVAAAALVTGGSHDAAVDWVRLLLAPVVEGFDYVCPAYWRGRLDGMLSTAIAYPLTRALYGTRIRQPVGGEAAFSVGLARKLLADPDWRRDPAQAGSDAWLVAKVLAGRARACQAWLGRWPSQHRSVHEDASHSLARLIGPLFHEMERHADRWQRREGSEPAHTVGEAGALDDEPVAVDCEELATVLRLGIRDLSDVWGLVLPPATIFALRRAASLPSDRLRIDDALWARVVYDFAVAHYTRAMERQQLLRAMTPIYLGWVAGFVNDVRALDVTATEARVEMLCTAFEREKGYAISRWRWPDSFNP